MSESQEKPLPSGAMISIRSPDLRSAISRVPFPTTLYRILNKVEPLDCFIPAKLNGRLRSDSYPIDAAIEEGFSGLSAELVHWLADLGVELVGIDTPSVDVFSSEKLPAHHALLERGMTWIEGLWLGDAKPGRYFMVAVPILLEGAEAAPVRAILKPLTT